VDVKIRGNQLIERLYALEMPAPFLSVLIDDCIATGRDYNAGGARYNNTFIQAVGIGTITDSLAAIRTLVFEDGAMSLKELLGVLLDDFAGAEPLRQRLLHRMPKYGNDDDRADDLMVRVFEAGFAAIDGRPNTKGGAYRIEMLPTTCHVYFGSVCGATPDGRRAGMPLSEGISPVQGADRNGPTAVLNSAAKMDHVRTGGNPAEPEVHAVFVGGCAGASEPRGAGAVLLRHGRPPRPVQRGHRRHPAPGSGGSRCPSRTDRPCGRLFGLLLRPVQGAAGGDHCAHGTRQRVSADLKSRCSHRIQ
jgi:hypothetical protein